ncbi:MAG: Thioredoxin [uncultured Sulfurovum sp.]|uniref:Thioredoxin n=1 Tax=uncultured Sulfurovum sp. TaxID=269237 RepID=A0A6S6T1F0_9BACT|nr:MAG: Thioredoxin [uncultured Sulfurovum sp.]
MTKIITTLILALFLTACTSQDNGEEKKFNTEKKVEVAPKTETTVENSELKTTEKKVTAQPVTYPKNIFKLADVDGNKLHVDEAENGIIFQEHKGKVVFLLFFGYRCPPCLEEIPVLKEMVKEKGDKLAVIGLEVQRLPEEQLKIFKESKKLNYSVLSGEHTENSNFVSYIAQRAQWTGSIPFLVGIKPSGEVGVVHLGGMGKRQFEEVFNELSK